MKNRLSSGTTPFPRGRHVSTTTVWLPRSVTVHKLVCRKRSSQMCGPWSIVLTIIRNRFHIRTSLKRRCGVDNPIRAGAGWNSCTPISPLPVPVVFQFLFFLFHFLFSFSLCLCHFSRFQFYLRWSRPLQNWKKNRLNLETSNYSQEVWGQPFNIISGGHWRSSHR